jgi:hypothetical protein
MRIVCGDSGNYPWHESPLSFTRGERFCRGQRRLAHLWSATCCFILAVNEK